MNISWRASRSDVETSTSLQDPNLQWLQNRPLALPPVIVRSAAASQRQGARPLGRRNRKSHGDVPTKTDAVTCVQDRQAQMLVQLSLKSAWLFVYIPYCCASYFSRLVVYIPKSMYYSTYSLGVFGMYTTILEYVYILKYGCIHTIKHDTPCHVAAFDTFYPDGFRTL